MHALRQQTLFSAPPSPEFSWDGLRRIHLSPTAWADYRPGWLSGHEPLFETLRDTLMWTAGKRVMYEREVDVPRLTAHFPDCVPDGAPGCGEGLPPILKQASRALSQRYGWPLTSIGAALYRDGRDSVAWHGDRMGELKDDCVIGIVSLGAPRPFRLRPHAEWGEGGERHAFNLGWGDLLVMGGTAQRTWEHCVPKRPSTEPRMSLMFRPKAPAAPATG